MLLAADGDKIEVQTDRGISDSDAHPFDDLGSG